MTSHGNAADISSVLHDFINMGDFIFMSVILKVLSIYELPGKLVKNADSNSRMYT